VEDQVQFANVLETSVEYLYKHLDEVEYTELALVLVHHKDKIESCIVSVNDTYVSSTMSVCLLQQRRHRKEGGRVLVLALSHQRVHLFKQRLLLVDGEPRVAAQQPRNAVVVEDEHRMDHSVYVCVCCVLCVVCCLRCVCLLVVLWSLVVLVCSLILIFHYASLSVLSARSAILALFAATTSTTEHSTARHSTFNGSIQLPQEEGPQGEGVGSHQPPG
jgi:hypothetical protein